MTNNFWRTLLRVERVDKKLAHIFVIIPSWDWKRLVPIPSYLIPSEIYAKLRRGSHFFAYVNIGVEHVDELCFKDFELGIKN